LPSSKPNEHCASVPYSILCPKSATSRLPSHISSQAASRNRPPHRAERYKPIRVSVHPTGCELPPSRTSAALTKPKQLRSSCSRCSLNLPSLQLPRLPSLIVKYLMH